MKPKRRFVLRIAVAAGALLAGITFGTGTGAAEDSVIVYGGMGHLSNKAQPIFGEIFEGRAQHAARLRKSIEKTIREAVAETAFDWSEFPVVFDFEDANAIMTERYRAQGREWNRVRPTIHDLQDAVGRVYTLAVVADLELDLKSPPHVDGAEYANMVASSVTALLVDMETKEIALSATDVRHQQIFNSAGFLPKNRITELLVATYKNAASVAVGKLAQKMTARAASDEFDRHMITGTLFPGSTAQGLFELEPWSNKVPSVCSLPAQCSSSGVCSKLTGLVSAVATSALSNADKLVLPPIGWTYWADRSTNLIALNLIQPRGGMLEETLTIRLPAEEAEVKSLVEVYVSKPKLNKPSSNSKVWSGTRYDKAVLKLHRYTTDPDDCSKSPVPDKVLQVEGSHESIISSGYTDPSVDVVRLYALGAILDATAKLEKEIRKQ